MSDLRSRTLTQKVETKFGTLYAHVEYGADARATEVRFSSPGKFSDTTIGEVLDGLGEAVTDILHAIR